MCPRCPYPGRQISDIVRSCNRVAIVVSTALGVGLVVTPIARTPRRVLAGGMTVPQRSHSCPARPGTPTSSRPASPCPRQARPTTTGGRSRCMSCGSPSDQPGVSFQPLRRADRTADAAQPARSRPPPPGRCGEHRLLRLRHRRPDPAADREGRTARHLHPASTRDRLQRRAGGLQSGTVHLAAKLFAGKQAHDVSGINEPLRAAASRPTTGVGWTPAAEQLAGRTPARLSAEARRQCGSERPCSTGWLRADAAWAAAPTGCRRSRPAPSTGLAGKVHASDQAAVRSGIRRRHRDGETNGQTRIGPVTCNSANTTQPARTAFGIADGGKTFVIGEVEDHPGTGVHGLDNEQMSGLHGPARRRSGVQRRRLRLDRDACEAARLSRLTRAPTRPTGKERPMPVGLGIAYVTPKVVHHKHHHHKKH